MKLQNKVLAAGAALVLSGLVSNQDVEASEWQARSVETIREEIDAQIENQDDTDVIEYTFKEGDTLWGISEATDIPVSTLTQVNSIANKNLIFVGNSIYLSEDNTVVSVKDENNNVTSYDVTEEVKETETPEEVTEKAEESSQVEETQAPAEEVANQAQEESAQAEQAQEEVVASAPEQQAQQEPAQASQTSSSSTGSLIGTFNATAYAVGDGLTPSTVTANGTNVANTIYSNGRRIIAVDPAIIPLGTTVEVHIPGWSPFTAVAADTGGAINGNKIDLLVSSPQEARNFGRQGGIQIYRVN